MLLTFSIYQRIFVGIIICTFVVSGVYASNLNDAARANSSFQKSSSMVAQNLTRRLKADLVQENVSVKLGNVEQTALSNTEIKLEGDATCLLPIEKTQLPIKFEAKINLIKQTVDDVQYAFVDGEYAPSSEEEILMKELMKQISQDYKTQEIVMAIDNFESAAFAEDKTQYKGFGEVRVGEIGWSKINFNVVLNPNKTAAKIEYKIQK